jgi:shikimate kinase
MPRLTLIGYRACGKSTVGRLVAARLAWPFIDADQVVEERLGAPIAQVFRTHGEAHFRAAESAVLAEILARTGPFVLATGGGVVEAPANRDLLLAHGGLVVYLYAAAELVQERLRHQSGGRPSLTGGHVADEVPAILARREPLYRAVATVVIPSGPTIAGVADQVAKTVESLPPDAL